MRIASLKEKRVVVFGFGREGQATFAVLADRGVDHLVVTDDVALESPAFVPLNRVPLDAATVVIKSPGIPPHHPLIVDALARGATITSSTNIFFAERKGRGCVIGVTGTKGKSTTASLLAHVLRTAGKQVVLAGNIGDPAMAHLDDPDDTCFVVELSSYQLADLTTPPDIGIILNLYEEHMDWHGSVELYQAAKLRIGELMSERDTFIYNDGFPELRALAKRIPAKTVPFHLVDDIRLLSLRLKGAHHRENACAVLMVARLLAVSDMAIEHAFATFVPLPHRLEEIGPIDGILYVNDSIATIPQSALAAIDVYADRLRVIILGGKDRGYDFASLAQRLAALPRVFVCVLPGGDRIVEALERVGVNVLCVPDLVTAVLEARKCTTPGDVVLLSPASPSYGQFKNFEERGEAFRRAVLCPRA